MAIKIVVIGYGAIGRMVVEELGKLDSSVSVCGVLVKPSRLTETRAALSERVAVLTDAVDALRLNPDLIVECAGQEAVVAYGEEILAAGCDGIERSLELPPISEGDMYTEPGDCVPLATDLTGAIEAFEGSGLASMLGDEFSRSFVSLAREEERLAAENNPDPDDVNDWERARYLEFS